MSTAHRIAETRPSSRGHFVGRVGWTVLVSLIALAWSVGALKAAERQPRLAGFYEAWLGSVEHLTSTAEEEFFAGLSTDIEREVFIRRFWDSRGEQLGLIEQWHDNRHEVLARFHRLEDPRARAVQVAGKPEMVMRLDDCGSLLRRLEVWSYDPWRAARLGGREGQEAGGGKSPGYFLVFYLAGNRDAGQYRQWSPEQGTEALMFGEPEGGPWSVEQLVERAQTQRRCLPGSKAADRLSAALRHALGEDRLLARAAVAATEPWLDELRSELADGEAGALLPVGEAELDLLGAYQQKTLLRGRVRLPVELLQRNAAGELFDRVVIEGDIYRGSRLMDAFQVVHHIAGAEPAGSTVVEIDFYRRLRPAAYRLELRVADRFDRGLLRQQIELEVPSTELEAVPPGGARLGFVGLTRAEVGVMTTFPSVELRPPPADLLAGVVEVPAVTAGGPIERVDFLLDGSAVGSDDQPPYQARLELGDRPERQLLQAVAVDPAGTEIARHEVWLNDDPPRFRVRILEPLSGRPSQQVKAEVDVPAGERLARLELYSNDRLLASFVEPPFVHPLPSPAGGGTSFVRAVAVLEAGEQVEDLVVVRSAAPVEQVEVQLVELFVTVTDARGRPVTNLRADELRVLENGVEQPVERFAPVAEMEIDVGLLMDVSGSMRGRVRLASQAAQRFFAQVLTAGDRASLMTFDHDLVRRVPWSGEVERLKYAAEGARARGTTRLYDGLVWALHSFGGLDGRRALVLLSDGEDTDSDFQFKQVLERALRSGVAVYPILLDLADEETRAELRSLADASGGRAFSIDGANDLDRTYQQIERELRAQYLLVYEPPPPSGGNDFRQVRVEVTRPGHRARTLHGYYP